LISLSNERQEREHKKTAGGRLLGRRAVCDQSVLQPHQHLIGAAATGNARVTSRLHFKANSSMGVPVLSTRFGAHRDPWCFLN
jgi:hypothetical protein